MLSAPLETRSESFASLRRATRTRARDRSPRVDHPGVNYPGSIAATDPIRNWRRPNWLARRPADGAFRVIWAAQGDPRWSGEHVSAPIARAGRCSIGDKEMAADPTLTRCSARRSLPMRPSCWSREWPGSFRVQDRFAFRIVSRSGPFRVQDRLQEAIFEPAHTAPGDDAIFLFAARRFAQGQVLFPAIRNPGGGGSGSALAAPVALRLPDELARL
jgi:hypothetical protein